MIIITKLEWRKCRRFSAWTIGSCVEILTRIPAQSKSSAFGGTRLLGASLLKYRLQFWRHPLFLSHFVMTASLTVPQWLYFCNLQLTALNTNLYQNDECYSWQNMSYTVGKIYRTEFLCDFKCHFGFCGKCCSVLFSSKPYFIKACHTNLRCVDIFCIVVRTDLPVMNFDLWEHEIR